MPARPAFTFIELVLVIVLMAVLSTSTIFAFDDLQDKTRLQAQQNLIVSGLQQARNSASNTVISSDLNIAYYRLDVRRNLVSLWQADYTADNKAIKTADRIDAQYFNEWINLVSPSTVPWSVWYLPPSATVCLKNSSATATGFTCDTSVTSSSFTITSPRGRYQSTITVSTPGGFPEVVGPTHL